MKILFTGASSFTGFWFVKTLAATGHEIFCPLTKNPADYNQFACLFRAHPSALKNS